MRLGVRRLVALGALTSAPSGVLAWPWGSATTPGTATTGTALSQTEPSSFTTDAIWDYEYIVIGAGSAGLQMGLFLQEANASYRIYEKGPAAGTFWSAYPVTGELISANSNSQSERYDWHSLLGHPLRFRNITKRFFPQREDFRSYVLGRILTPAPLQLSNSHDPYGHHLRYLRAAAESLHVT